MESENKLYVGNLNFETSEDELKGYFEQNGITPKSVTIIKDKYTGRARGFGFVEVDSAEALEKAIEALNGQEFAGRKLVINKARSQRERTDRPPRGGNDFGGPRRQRF